MDARWEPKLVQTPWEHKPVALQEDMNPLTRHPQHQRDLGKEQEVPQLEKVRHIIGNGTWTGWEKGWEADDVGSRLCGQPMWLWPSQETGSPNREQSDTGAEG